MDAVRGSPVSSAVPAKLGAMAVLGGAALFASLLPVLLAKRCATSRAFLDYLLRLGGGVLLATTFLHLLPEVRESLEELQDQPSLPLPLPELLMCAGFFLMYALEELAHKFLGHHHHHDLEKAALHRPPHPAPSLTLDEIKREFLRLSEDSSVLSAAESEDELFAKESAVLWSKARGKEDRLRLVMEDRDSHHHHWEAEKARTPLRAVLITLALSVHQLFEGMAVGLETHPGQVWVLTGAVAAHKVVIAVCVGAESAGSPPCSLALLLASFCLATPLGIAAGLGLSDLPGLPAVLLQGLAAGTLLFVVFFEVLQRATPQLGHFLVTAAGFLLMLALLCLFQS